MTKDKKRNSFIPFVTFIAFFASMASFAFPLGAVPVSQVQVAPKKGVAIAVVDLQKVFQAYPATKKAKEDLASIILVKENEILAKRTEIFKIKEEIARLKNTVVTSTPTPTEVIPATSTPLLSPTTAQSPPFLPAPSLGPDGQESKPAESEQAGSEAALLPQTSATTAGVDLALSTPTPSPLEALIIQKEQELKTRQQESKKLERDAEKNLQELEEAKTKALLGRIFQAINEIAQEKNVDIIVDKNAILWGSARLDLTKDLLEKLKSKYIERE